METSSTNHALLSNFTTAKISSDRAGRDRDVEAGSGRGFSSSVA